MNHPTPPIKHVQLFAETLSLAMTDQGQGQTYLVLHGGAGPLSVTGLATALSSNARVITPVHPGFASQPRPQWFNRVSDLALAYIGLLEKLDLRDVIVIGNSIGGWIAAEMALRKSPRVAGIMLLNAAGIDTGSPDRKIIDPMAISPAERTALAFHDPARYAIAPTTPEALAAMQANQQTLRVYAGEPFMHDPSLRTRLADIDIPTMVVWGESDRIVDVDYGRLFAQSIPGATFEGVKEAGHFPHIEQLQKVMALTTNFTSKLTQKQENVPA
jgi:pimeloyl-ACP methyl ester carboxylesterase